MEATNAIAYRAELLQPTDDQIAHWRAIVPDGKRLPVLTGNCPACHHECEVSISDVAVQGGVPSTAGPPAVEMTRQLICNCRMKHPRQSGVAGCGRYWLGRVTRRDGGGYDLAVEHRLGLLRAASALNEVAAKQDQMVQASAEKWLGAIAAVYGLFSLTGVATGRNALEGIGTAGRWWVAGFLLAATAVATAALVTGYTAAYGWPRMTSVRTDEELEAWYEGYKSYATVASRRLRYAVVLAFLSLAAVSVVMLLVWFLPRSPAV